MVWRHLIRRSRSSCLADQAGDLAFSLRDIFLALFPRHLPLTPSPERQSGSLDGGLQRSPRPCGSFHLCTGLLNGSDRRRVVPESAESSPKYRVWLGQSRLLESNGSDCMDGRTTCSTQYQQRRRCISYSRDSFTSINIRGFLKVVFLVLNSEPKHGLLSEPPLESRGLASSICQHFYNSSIIIIATKVKKKLTSEFPNSI